MHLRGRDEFPLLLCNSVGYREVCFGDGFFDLGPDQLLIHALLRHEITKLGCGELQRGLYMSEEIIRNEVSAILPVFARSGVRPTSPEQQPIRVRVHLHRLKRGSHHELANDEFITDPILRGHACWASDSVRRVAGCDPCVAAGGSRSPLM